MKMHRRKEVNWRITKTSKRKVRSHDNPLGENSKNPAKKQEKTVLKPNELQEV